MEALTQLNSAHLHLLLNHIPTIGTLFALGMIVMSFLRRSEELKRVSLELFAFIALLTLPVYLTGVAAQDEIQHLSGVSNAALAAHQDHALIAFIGMEITGAAAWVGRWQASQTTRPVRWSALVVLLLSVATVTMMARAATLGGEIRHPEIVPDGAWSAEPRTDPEATPFNVAAVAAFVNDRAWVWPASETLHFIGMSLSFGVLLVVNLRLLGVIGNVSLAAVQRLLPWGLLGFGINLATGMLFFIAAPQQYTSNDPFEWKMLLLVLAGLNFLYLTIADEASAPASGGRPPVLVRVAAASSLVFWIGVMVLGRLLPFAGNAF